jgi:hypothetical protein
MTRDILHSSWEPDPSDAQWTMTSIRRVVLTATILLAALATGSTAPQAGAANAGRNSLTVTVQWGEGSEDVWTLRCDPLGGTHPNRRRACAFLESLARPFSALPTGMACTMLYSGPEKARVVGRWHGKRVNTSFARNDGCATARWQQYRALLTDPGLTSLRGRVDLGPTCPVQQEGQSCEVVGAPATVTATSGARTRKAMSGTEGFLLRLPRDVWEVTADAGMHCPTVSVDTRVRPAPEPLVISCDTGIRTSAH